MGIGQLLGMGRDGYLETGTVRPSPHVKGSALSFCFLQRLTLPTRGEKHTGLLLSKNSFFLCLEVVLFLNVRSYVYKLYRVSGMVFLKSGIGLLALIRVHPGDSPDL